MVSIGLSGSTGQFLQDGGGEDGENLFQSLALAVVEHRSPNDGISAQNAVLLGLFEASQEGRAEVDGLNLVAGRKVGFEFLTCPESVHDYIIWLAPQVSRGVWWVTCAVCLLRVPKGKELVQGPFDALDPLLLRGKNMGVEPGPVGEEVEVEKTQVSQEDGKVGRDCWYLMRSCGMCRVWRLDAGVAVLVAGPSGTRTGEERLGRESSHLGFTQQLRLVTSEPIPRELSLPLPFRIRGGLIVRN